MKKPTLSESNIELWRLMNAVNHLIELIRQKELYQKRIPVRQYGILGSIKALGSNATLSEIAKQAERKYSVISRQVLSMEKDGLIKRIKDSPNSNLMRLDLTEKGLTLMEIAKKNKSIDSIFSFLTKAEREQLVSILNRMLIKARKLNPD